MSPEVRKLPPPVHNHPVHLLANGLHVGIGKARVQRAHAVRVRTRSADGVVEFSLALGGLLELAEPFHSAPPAEVAPRQPRVP
jgi:hypothetical protein